MLIARTEYFERVLKPIYERLRSHPVALNHLTGSFRMNGRVVSPGALVELDDVAMSSAELAQILLMFDGARVHTQPESRVGRDEAPPGLYFTSVEPTVQQDPHKTRVGVYEETGDPQATRADEWEFIEDGAYSEYLDEGYGIQVGGALHIDHLYLRHQAPDGLATVAFALCAITAHRLGYLRITLLAAGGVGYDERMIGYRYWPKLGFNAPLDEQDEGSACFANCATVLDVIENDESAWEVHGTQRLMEFDLAPDSRSWRKLLDYLREKDLA